jgi:ubiquinone biosynthesis protein
MRLFRLLKIASVGIRFGLDQLLLEHEPTGRLAFLMPVSRRLFFWRNLAESRGARLRQALEALGPIFVKFGQVLSTRRDLLPQDIADELAKLQDQVPPFASSLALAELQKAYGKPVDQIFREFDPKPVASASVAQVHFAVLPDGREVAVKILRPNMRGVLENDLALQIGRASCRERVS